MKAVLSLSGVGYPVVWALVWISTQIFRGHSFALEELGSLCGTTHLSKIGTLLFNLLRFIFLHLRLYSILNLVLGIPLC